MSRDAEKGGFGDRLWGGAHEPEREPQTDDKVVPLKRPAGDRAYLAFETSDRAERLHIVRGAGPSRFPSYSYLLDISFDHHLQSAFTLIYTFMIVEVTGRNLETVVPAIGRGKSNCSRESHAKLNAPPAEAEPFIEKITITAADEKLS